MRRRGGKAGTGRQHLRSAARVSFLGKEVGDSPWAFLYLSRVGAGAPTLGRMMAPFQGSSERRPGNQADDEVASAIAFPNGVWE